MAFYHHIHCKYTDVKGFVNLYNYYLKHQYMITVKARKRLKILVFWKKYGLEATLEAFKVKERTLYLWQAKLKQSGGKIESLNDQSKAPVNVRKRQWPLEIINEITRLRNNYPNLGKDKIHPILQEFCRLKNIECPGVSTIGRIIKDQGGLRTYPQKVTHFGKLKPLKRKKKLRKPKGFKTTHPGHLVALDTIEKHLHGIRRYVITFEDIHTRFSFAWATCSHASKAAEEFFNYCLKVFPFPIKQVLTDNGSEFAKHFSERLKKLHLVHYHTYPKTPKMNAHVERFNRTLQEEFIDYYLDDLYEVNIFNYKLVDYLIWYNTRRVHWAFKNKQSPVQYILSLSADNFNLPQKCKSGWTYT